MTVPSIDKKWNLSGASSEMIQAMKVRATIIVKENPGIKPNKVAKKIIKEFKIKSVK